MGKAIRVVDYIADFIAGLGTRNIFMLTGTGSVYLDDALAFHPELHHVCARHEAAAVMMAEASAKLTGDLGVVISTTGPGATNAIGGVAEAWVDSVPLLIISGQVPTEQVLPGIRSFGIQGFNIIENVRAITKYAEVIDDPLDLRFHLEKSVSLALEGRRGPVWLDLPMDIQTALVEPDKLRCYEMGHAESTADAEELTDAVSCVDQGLASAERPLLLFGQGIGNSCSEDMLRRFISDSHIPSAHTRMGSDILAGGASAHLGLVGVRGIPAANAALKEADLVIALGCSLTHAVLGEQFDLIDSDAQIVVVNTDAAEIKKLEAIITRGFQVDVRKFLEELVDRGCKPGLNFDSRWSASAVAAYEKQMKDFSSLDTNPINSYYLARTIDQITDSSHIIANDAGSANYVCSQAMSFANGQREVTSGAFYSMGVAIPLAIGAACTERDKTVIVVTGDGSIELNIQELRTISQNTLNIKVIVINNGGYASIRKSQDDMADGRYTDDIEILDFRAVSKAFELPYALIDDAKKLPTDLPKLISTKGPVLIEVVCDSEQEMIDSFNSEDTLLR